MTEPEVLSPEPPADKLDNLLRITHVMYGLQAACFVAGVTALIAVVINYIKKDDVRGTWLESHFRWQRRTFWLGIAMGVPCVLLMFVGIGFLLLFPLGIWLIYRVAKGWLALMDNKSLD